MNINIDMRQLITQDNVERIDIEGIIPASISLYWHPVQLEMLSAGTTVEGRESVSGRALLYQFQQDYFELKVDRFIRLDGVKMQLPKTELYFTYGVSLGVLITDRIRIKTQGFSLEEGTEVDVYDYTTSFSESGDLLINQVENPTLNGFVYSSLRAEYQLDEKLRLLCEPNVGISITPNFTGTQTANAIRIGCSLGLVYPVE